jgi:oligopeptide transport system permease protein
MLRYLARRIVLMFVALFVICTTTFFLMHFLPGSPFNDEKLSEETRAQLEAKYGLNESLVVQYATYMKNLAQGDLGNSFYYEGRPVLEIILNRLPVSAFLGVQAVLLGLFAGLGLGIVAALRHNSVWDSAATVLAVLGVSVPSFVLGPLLQYWVGVKLGLLPIAFFESWAHSVLPSLTLSVFVTATVARFVRSEMLEVLGQDYVALARSKGLSERAVVVRHALRNALVPLVTVLFPLTVFLITGSLIVEQIFAVPGIGEQFVRAIVVTDYSMIMGTTIFFSVFFILALLIQDILYGLIDPRIRTWGGKSRHGG